MRVPGIRRAGRSAALVCAFLLVSACGTELFPITLRVDSDAVGDIRGIGKVLRESTDETSWDGVNKVSVVLVIDIGQPGAEGAVDTASSLLQKRGWTASIDRHPESVWMESRKWPGTGLMIKGIEYYESHDGLDSNAEKAIEDAQAQTGSTGIVVLEAERTDE